MSIQLSTADAACIVLQLSTSYYARIQVYSKQLKVRYIRFSQRFW